MSSLFMTASIVGPSLGGLLYGLGPFTCYSISTLGFVIAFCGTLALRLDHTPPQLPSRWHPYLPVWDF